MKKTIIIGLAFLFFSNVLGQKKELKNIEKLIKSENYTEAFNDLKLLQDLISSGDNKLKSKFNYLKGLTYYQNGKSTFDFQVKAINEFKLSISHGVNISSDKSKNILDKIYQEHVEKYVQYYDENNFVESRNYVESAYRIYEKDTLFLYNAAVLAKQAKLYEKSLSHFFELIDIGYTGIGFEYYATNILTNESDLFVDKKSRDSAIKQFTHNNPSEIRTESKEILIYKEIARIYSIIKEYNNALKYLNQALNSFPNNLEILQQIARVYVDMEDWNNYEITVSKILEMDPDNYEILTNLAIVNKDAKKYETAFEYVFKAIEVDEKNERGLFIASELYLIKADEVFQIMINLPLNSSGERKYNELETERNKLILKSIEYFEMSLQIDNITSDTEQYVFSELKRLYALVGDDEKFDFYKNLLEP